MVSISLNNSASNRHLQNSPVGLRLVVPVRFKGSGKEAAGKEGKEFW